MALIGVAVAVPDPYGEELERWRAEFGDPQASRIPAHITMLPPVRVDDAELESVDLHLTRAAGSVTAYDVILKGTGTFRPVSPVVFVALAAGISGCERLQAAVHRAPLDPLLDHPYHPHVTVAHHLPDDALDRAFQCADSRIKVRLEKCGKLKRRGPGKSCQAHGYVSRQVSVAFIFGYL